MSLLYDTIRTVNISLHSQAVSQSHHSISIHLAGGWKTCSDCAVVEFRVQSSHLEEAKIFRSVLAGSFQARGPSVWGGGICGHSCHQRILEMLSSPDWSCSVRGKPCRQRIVCLLLLCAAAGKFEFWALGSSDRQPPPRD